MRRTLRTVMVFQSVPLSALVCILLLLQLSACTGSRQAPSFVEQQPTSPAAVDTPVDSPLLDFTPPAPEGVDAKLWARLVNELERVLAEEGTARRTAAVPTGQASAVCDLGLYIEGSSTHYTWSYRNQGDYDLNGEVNISDLTMIGLHFGKNTLSDDWQQAQLADGDCNMEVNISDVTPIGTNFGGRVDGYELQSRLDDSSPFAKEAEFVFTPGDTTTGIYPPFEHIGPLVLIGPSYRVVPYVEDGSQRTYGVASYIVGSGHNSFEGRWHTMRGSDARTGRSSVAGPASVGGTWSIELGGGSEMSVFVEPVVDRTGMIYVGGIAIETITSDIPIGHFYAISPNGNLAWNFPTVMGVLMPAATNRMGRIVVGDFGGMVYCLAPDGKQIWRRQLAGTLMFSGLLVDDQGTVFILSHNQSALEIISSTLYKLSSTGEIEWSRALDSGCKGSPFLNPDGDVTVVDEQGQVYSFDYAGNSTFNFTMPDAVADNIFAAGAMIHGNSIGYSTLNDTVRFHNYDDTFSFTISFPGEEPKSMPAVNHQNHIVFVSRTTVSPEVSRLNYYNVNVELWDIDLSGEQTSNLAIDNADRMYFSTIHQISGNNGVYCVKPDQSVAWFHSFGEEWVLSVAIASEGLLVCSSVTEGAQAGGVFKITGIYE